MRNLSSTLVLMVITIAFAETSLGQTVLYQNDFEARTLPGLAASPVTWTQGRGGGTAAALLSGGELFSTGSFANFALEADLFLGDLGANGSVTIWMRRSAINSNRGLVRWTIRPALGQILTFSGSESGTFNQTIPLLMPILYDTWHSFRLEAARDRARLTLNGTLLAELTIPAHIADSFPAGIFQIQNEGLDSLRIDNLSISRLPPLEGCVGGLGSELAVLSSPTRGLTFNLCSTEANAPIYVLLDTLPGSISLSPYGATQLAFSPEMISLAAAAPVFGPSVSAVTQTDSDGAWSLSFPEILMFYLYGSRRSLYAEAYVISLAAPNGLFFQSALQTYVSP